MKSLTAVSVYDILFPKLEIFNPIAQSKSCSLILISLTKYPAISAAIDCPACVPKPPVRVCPPVKSE